jgi:hypothetical protein
VYDSYPGIRPIANSLSCRAVAVCHNSLVHEHARELDSVLACARNNALPIPYMDGCVILSISQIDVCVKGSMSIQ